MSAAKDINRLEFEQGCLRRGLRRIAGVDEAGRGPLAGPVVAAAVIFPAGWLRAGLPEVFDGLNDSKQLTKEQREKYYLALNAFPEIRQAIVCIEAGVIDEINILQATHRAMNEALRQLMPEPDHVLVDGLHVKTLQFSQTSIVKGDSLSYSIAAASVLAKVTRDRLMVEYDLHYPAYGFASHKGYGTAQHLAALTEHGPCPIHRRSFAPVRLDQLELF